MSTQTKNLESPSGNEPDQPPKDKATGEAPKEDTTNLQVQQPNPNGIKAGEQVSVSSSVTNGSEGNGPKPPDPAVAPTQTGGAQTAGNEFSYHLTKEQRKAQFADHKSWRAMLALCVWVVLFSLGLLVETVHHRYFLAPINVSQQLGQSGLAEVHKAYPAYVKSETEEVSGIQTNSEGVVNGEPAAPPQTPPKPPTNETVMRKVYVPSSKILNKEDKIDWQKFWPYIVSLFCFTPINLAMLAFCSGLIGGYAANISYGSMSDEMLKELLKDHPTRRWYLEEPPTTAAIRGFVVFLCVIAGLYVAIDDPFKDPSSGQYIRLAGTLSALAFIVGYDASRLDDWLKVIPSPLSRSSENDNKRNTIEDNKTPINPNKPDGEQGGGVPTPNPPPQ